MNLLNLFIQKVRGVQSPLYIYSGHPSQAGRFLKTVSRVFRGRPVVAGLRTRDVVSRVPENVFTVPLDLSEPLAEATAHAFHQVMAREPFDWILVQNDVSGDSYNMVDLLPLLSGYGRTHRIVFLDRNFQMVPVNDLISVWSEPVHLKDAALTIDCPGLMTSRELAHLQRLAQRRPSSDVVVEIGRYYGRSTIALGHGVKQTGQGTVISIDPWLAPDAWHRISDHCVSKHVELWNETSRSAHARWLRERKEETIGMVFIDGDHRYPSVAQDIDLWAPLLMPGGTIALHDYHEAQPDCLLALNEKILWSGDFEDIQLKDSLLIARKKKSNTDSRKDAERLSKTPPVLEPTLEPVDYAQVPEISEKEIEMIETVRPFTLTSLERMWALIQSVHHIHRNRIAGDIVECGVYKGGSIFLSKLTAARFYPDSQRNYFLYDTFAGSTEPGAVDVDREGVPAKKVYDEVQRGKRADWIRTSEEDVQKNAWRIFEDISDLIFIKGPVETTLREAAHLPPKIALLRLDTDFYESTKTELEILYPRLQPGGVLIVDDYGHYRGAQMAVDEFFADQPVFFHRLDYTGRLIIKP